MIGDGVRNGAIRLLRDPDDLRQLKVRRAELFELLDDPVRVRPAEAELAGTELLPRGRSLLVAFALANLSQTFRVGGRALVGDEPEGLPSSDPRPELEQGVIFVDQFHKNRPFGRRLL